MASSEFKKINKTAGHQLKVMLKKMNITFKGNTNSWYTPIDKLMLWRGSWIKYERTASNLFLRLICDQLLITADTKILETFNMHHKMKGIYKDDILILILNNGNNEIRKIKFLLKSDIAQSLEVLGRHFPVVSHNSIATNQVNTKYRNIQDILRYAVDRRETTGVSNLPDEFENFVKLCLLDPSFPQMLTETEVILNKEILKK